MPTISIIVPVYKVEPYLKRCIDSILSQTFDDFELILVDDGSPDNCGKICDCYGSTDSRITVMHQNNQGQAVARNNALDYVFQKSNSEWITFIDSDDWVHPDYLKMLYQAAAELNAGISQCPFIETSEMTVDYPAIQPGSYKMVTVDQALYREGRVEIDGYACGKLYRKELLIKYRFPVGMLFEDFYVVPEIMLQVETVAMCKEPMYYYFQRSDSTVWSKKDERYICDKWTGYEKLIPLFREHGQNRLADIMTKAYVFWTQSLTETIQDESQKKMIRKHGRKLVRRYPKVAGLPFHMNIDILVAFYPLVGNIHKELSNWKRKILGRKRT